MRIPNARVSNATAISIIVLAISIVYFAKELSDFTSMIPGLVNEIHSIQEKVDPVIKESEDIREFIPGVLKEVESLLAEISPLIREFSEVRSQIPEILDEAALHRVTVDNLILEATEYRKQIPFITQEREAVEKLITEVINESQLVRQTVPEILAEVEAVRIEIPKFLHQAQEISDNIKRAGLEASEGAVQGVISGIIKAPFSMIFGWGNPITSSNQELSEEDRTFMQEAALKLLNSGEDSEQIQWENPGTKVSGVAVIEEMSVTMKSTCKTIKVTLARDGTVFNEGIATICQKPGESWVLSE